MYLRSFVRLLLLTGILAGSGLLSAAAPAHKTGISVVFTFDDPPAPTGGPPKLEVIKDHLIVDYTLPGGPGALAGLQQGDEVTQIEDQKVAGMKFTAALELIRGPAGTTVDLTVIRNGIAQPFILTVTRNLQ